MQYLREIIFLTANNAAERDYQDNWGSVGCTKVQLHGTEGVAEKFALRMTRLCAHTTSGKQKPRIP